MGSSLNGGCYKLLSFFFVWRLQRPCCVNGMTCLRMSGNDSLYVIVSAKELNPVSLGPHNSVEDVIKQ